MNSDTDVMDDLLVHSKYPFNQYSADLAGRALEVIKRLKAEADDDDDVPEFYAGHLARKVQEQSDD